MVSTEYGTSWDIVYAHKVDSGGGGSWPMVTARDAGAAVVVAEGTSELVHIGVGTEPETVDVRGFRLPQQVVFATPDDGLIVTFDGRGGRNSELLLRTADGGRSWERVNFD